MALHCQQSCTVFLGIRDKVGQLLTASPLNHFTWNVFHPPLVLLCYSKRPVPVLLVWHYLCSYAMLRICTKWKGCCWLWKPHKLKEQLRVWHLLIGELQDCFFLLWNPPCNWTSVHYCHIWGLCPVSVKSKAQLKHPSVWDFDPPKTFLTAHQLGGLQHSQPVHAWCCPSAMQAPHLSLKMLSNTTPPEGLCLVRGRTRHH